MKWSEWKPWNLTNGPHGPEVGTSPGWYAYRTHVPAGGGLCMEYTDPFPSADAARRWCEEQNPPADVPVTAG